MNNYKEIKNIGSVFIRGNEIVITGLPDEEDENHDCDVMGCNSVDHIIFRGLLRHMEKGYSEEKQELALREGEK